MNLKHFGDSYDIVKKSLLEWLAEFGPWAAHPMFTHPISVSEAEAFSRFLGVPLVSTDVLNRACDRAHYFASCRLYHSLFLDPDTGIRLKTVKTKQTPAFLFGEDLINLATARPNALTLTFDQSLARGRERDEIRVKLAHFAAHGISGFAYVSHASFIVLGRSAVLVQQAHHGVLKKSALPANRIVTINDV
jgi:hypothetical protein